MILEIQAALSDLNSPHKQATQEVSANGTTDMRQKETTLLPSPDAPRLEVRLQTVAATQDLSNASSGDAENIERTTQLNPVANSTRVRLPKLELKRFDGELTMWIPFWDSFESAVHNSTELSPVGKFNYLKHCWMVQQQLQLLV